ncbi:hypothetical protein PGT21_028525 [Puccinia graminis f. sp. tritici]|uniref:Uncharacterized protein n=1 Tax=Puccinia graminis f. sp. tritici TaxID=56615 RepID=A0A5B0NKF6_PUCGR|nr:hypothetical protein PGT21_028525 [Puccinia graminis f. sp. tritici]
MVDPTSSSNATTKDLLGTRTGLTHSNQHEYAGLAISAFLNPLHLGRSYTVALPSSSTTAPSSFFPFLIDLTHTHRSLLRSNHCSPLTAQITAHRSPLKSLLTAQLNNALDQDKTTQSRPSTSHGEALTLDSLCSFQLVVFF